MAREIFRPQTSKNRLNIHTFFGIASLLISLSFVVILAYQAPNNNRNSGHLNLYLALLAGIFQILSSINFSRRWVVNPGLAWTAVKNLSDLKDSVAKSRVEAEKLKESMTAQQARDFTRDMSILLDFYELQISQGIETWIEVNPSFYEKLNDFYMGTKGFEFRNLLSKNYNSFEIFPLSREYEDGA